MADECVSGILMEFKYAKHKYKVENSRRPGHWKQVEDMSQECVGDIGRRRPQYEEAMLQVGREKKIWRPDYGLLEETTEENAGDNEEETLTREIVGGRNTGNS